jgi:glyoxylase-like metal-dependent hydrolase (beta-lactamase superfamily II)
MSGVSAGSKRPTNRQTSIATRTCQAVAICAAAALIAASALAPRLAAQTGVQTLRLYVFDCGYLINLSPETYNLTRQDVPDPTMSVACFLVVHPQGALLFDTGLGDKLVGRPPYLTRRGPAMSQVVLKTLSGQLAEIGFTPDKVRYLVLSHMHFDHVGNANDFAGPATTWLVQKVERDAMFGETAAPAARGAATAAGSAGTPVAAGSAGTSVAAGSAGTSVPASAAGINPDYAALRNAKTELLNGDRDVFGDGTVVIKSTPGHTVGHQVLFVKLPKTGAVVLSGDLYHYPGERTLNRMPDRERTAGTPESRAKIETLVHESGAQLWIGHDIQTFATLKKSPEYYD